MIVHHRSRASPEEVHKAPQEEVSWPKGGCTFMSNLIFLAEWCEFAKEFNDFTEMYIYILFCSKRKKKQLKNGGRLLEARIQKYACRSDDAPETDSKGSLDHHCRLENPKVRTCSPLQKRGNHVSVPISTYFRVKGAADIVSWLKHWPLAKTSVGIKSIND